MAPSTDTETPSRPARPRQKRGEGQWALGYREPLNPNEQSKKDDNPLNVRARIENIYSVRGFDSIDPGDMRGRFRWWGLYTQRRPGIDGGKTATLEPEELDDRYFMLRVRIDGGQLDLEQLRTIADISVEYAPRHRRPDRPPEHPAPLDRHQATSRTSGTGSSRSDSPPRRRAATARASSSAAPSPASPRTRSSTPRRRSRPSRASYIGDKAFSNLPRKYKTRDQRPPRPRRRAADQRHRVHRRGPPRARPRLRRLGRRRAVDQPDARQAPRRLGAARRGARGVGGHHQRLPRLRLPPAPLAGSPEVPDRRLGHREVPRGARDRVPRPQAHRPRRARGARDPRRPRGRVPPEGRPLHRRRRSERRPRLRHPAEPDRRRRRGPRLDSRAHDADAEAPRPRRRGGPGRVAHRRARRARPATRVRRSGAATPWRARASSTASSRSSRPRSAPPSSSPSSRSACPSSTPRSPSTSTAAPTPAPASRPPTSASRACSCSTRTATRSRASRCTSAGRSATTPGSAASCARTR